MNAPVMAQTVPARTGPAWQPAVLPIAVGTLVLGLLFNQEVAQAVQTWIDSTIWRPIQCHLPWYWASRSHSSGWRRSGLA